MPYNTHFASYGGVFFRKSQTYMKAAFKGMGLSFVEAIVLVNVCENQGIIQEKIAHNLALDDASVARSLKQMEKKKLVHRETNINNQRAKLVTPLPGGLKQKKLIDKAMDHWNDILLKEFSEVERECIVNSLYQLREKAIKINVDEVLKELRR
jgi:DNA-binding MarR family transcriptional regulator